MKYKLPEDPIKMSIKVQVLPTDWMGTTCPQWLGYFTNRHGEVLKFKHTNKNRYVDQQIQINIVDVFFFFEKCFVTPSNYRQIHLNSY